MKERQAKDGTIYQEVGPDQWQPVTRQAKDGTVYKKVGADAWQPMSMPQPEQPQDPGMVGHAQAMAEGFGESASLGTLPYIQAGAEKVGEQLADMVYGGSEAPPEAGGSYGDRVQRMKARSDEIQGASPYAAGAGQLAGFFVPGAGASKAVGKTFQGLTKVLAKGGKLANLVRKSGKASKLYKTARAAHLAAKTADAAGDAAKAAEMVAKAAKYTKLARADLVRQGIKFGAEGALLGAAMTPETGITDTKTRLQNMVYGGATGAVMPAAFHAGGKVLRGTGTAARKMMGGVLNTSDDVMARYLQNPERIRNANTFDEIEEMVSSKVAQFGDDLAKNQEAYKQADEQLKTFAAKLTQERKASAEEAKRVYDQGKELLNESFRYAQENLKQKASPTNVGLGVEDALTNLKNKVVEGSKKAFSILDETPGQAKSAQISKRFQKIAADLSKRGSAPANQARSKMESYIKFLNERPENMPLKDVKKLIQDIDADIKAWTGGPGSFDDPYHKALKEARSFIDKNLKKASPAYKKQMEEVAENTRLLSQAQKKFGKENNLTRLANVGKPTARKELETLFALSKKEGGELTQDIEKMVGAQKTLKSKVKMEGIKQNLPEYKQQRQNMMNYTVKKRAAKPQNIKQVIEQSAARRRAMTVKQQLDEAKETFKKFKSFGEQSVETKIKQVARGRKYARKQLQELSKLSDKDFVEMVDAAQDAAAFTKTAFNGSRNVNLWAAIGSVATSRGALGSAVGGVLGGPVGIGFGAVMGSMVDFYGPRMAKKILDGVINMKQLNVAAIKKLDLPPNVKKDLVESFKAAVLTRQISENNEETGMGQR